jgi:hypothetical protein
MGDNDPGKARNLVNEHGLDNMPLEAIGWLWPVLAMIRWRTILSGI